MIPVGQLMRELVVALGAALVVGNGVVLVRERFRTGGDAPRPNMKVVAINILLGTVMTAWGVASLLAG